VNICCEKSTNFLTKEEKKNKMIGPTTTTAGCSSDAER
jgi:hypothetical protein